MEATAVVTAVIEEMVVAVAAAVVILVKEANTIMILICLHNKALTGRNRNIMTQGRSATLSQI